MAIIRATAITAIIHATVTTPIMITAITAPIPITTGAIGIEAADWAAQFVRSHRRGCALAASVRFIEGEMTPSTRLGSPPARAVKPGSATHRQIGALCWPCKQGSARRVARNPGVIVGERDEGRRFVTARGGDHEHQGSARPRMPGPKEPWRCGRAAQDLRGSVGSKRAASPDHALAGA